MTVYKFRSLPYDVALCLGTNCTLRGTCARFLQIDQDRQREDKSFWIVYTDSPRTGDDCTIRWEIEP